MAELRDGGALPPFGGVSFAWYADDGVPNMNPASGDPLDAEDLTRCLVQTRRQAVAYVEHWRRRVPGFAAVRIEHMGALGVRESRRIRCRETLTGDDVVSGRSRPDAVGQGFWMVDVHDPRGSGYTTHDEHDRWLPAGRNYQIPFGMMVPVRMANLLVAGRCAGATHEGCASVRIQSHCMVMGQAAGTAAALAMRAGVAPGEVDIAALQARLVRDGVYIAGLSRPLGPAG
jgi:hypothetical protein